MFLKKRNISFKIKRSKVTDYATLTNVYKKDSYVWSYRGELELVLATDCCIRLDFIYEPVHEIFNKLVCATSKASDQPAHTRSLTRAFASRLSIL